MTPARRSRDRKYVVCGGCGRSLCRRDRRTLGEVGHYLAWDDGWRRVEDHLEFMPSAGARLAKGFKPQRHDWADADRLALSRFRRGYPPARCRHCGTLNEIDPQRLDVQGVRAR